MAANGADDATRAAAASERGQPRRWPEARVRAPSKMRVRGACEANGCSKLSAEAHELLRRVALERLQRGRHVFYCAIGEQLRQCNYYHYHIYIKIIVKIF